MTSFSFDLIAHLDRARRFSLETFGPGPRTEGVIDHIREELTEIEENPDDLLEWVDVMILAMDGALRAGHSPKDIAMALEVKQTINESRKWPDWRSVPMNTKIKHVGPKDDGVWKTP